MIRYAIIYDSYYSSIVSCKDKNCTEHDEHYHRWGVAKLILDEFFATHINDYQSARKEWRKLTKTQWRKEYE